VGEWNRRQASGAHGSRATTRLRLITPIPIDIRASITPIPIGIKLLIPRMTDSLIVVLLIPLPLRHSFIDSLIPGD